MPREIWQMHTVDSLTCFAAISQVNPPLLTTEFDSAQFSWLEDFVRGGLFAQLHWSLRTFVV